MRPAPLHVPGRTDEVTLLTRDRADDLVDRYSERTESAEAQMRRVNLSAAT